MSGPQVVERVIKLCPEMRILYTSGYTARALAELGAGPTSPGQPGIAFFAKPFTPESLADKVREMLDEPLDLDDLI
jgi:two-component system, cell cycle sensor histidine kinase and response regulator CckA